MADFDQTRPGAYRPTRGERTWLPVTIVTGPVSVWRDTGWGEEVQVPSFEIIHPKTGKRLHVSASRVKECV